MSEKKIYINFKTLAWKPIKGAESGEQTFDGSYPLSMLRSMLLLYGIYQLVPDNIEFREFARKAIYDRRIQLPGPFTILINQVLKFYLFDHDILKLSPGFRHVDGQELWFDSVRDPSTGQDVIFFKSAKEDGSSQILQIADLEPIPEYLRKIYELLQMLRVPEINLQELVDCVASNQQLLQGLRHFIHKLMFDEGDEIGALEIFLLLGQEKFKEWVLNEIVLHSAEMASPKEANFRYPTINLSSLPSFEHLNNAGLIETMYVLGFLGLSDFLKRNQRQPILQNIHYPQTPEI